MTRFFPHLKLINVEPTRLGALEWALEIGRREGLAYVYLGNISGHLGENTYCHRCGRLLIERKEFDIQ